MFRLNQHMSLMIKLFKNYHPIWNDNKVVALVLIEVKVKTDLEQHQTHIVSDDCHTYKCQKQWHLQFTRPWVRLLDDSFLCMAWVTICGQLCDVPVTFGGCHLKGKLDSYVHLHFIQNNVTSSSVNCIVNSYITWRPYAFQSDLFAP